MRHTILNKRVANSQLDRADGGFTLIEIAVSLMIIGLLLAPAIAAYNLYMERQKIERTDISIDRASTFITGFLDAYGRYPCPAPMDADAGDVEYGYEDCTAAAPSIITVESPNTALANRNILVGSVPFRTLNLEQDDMTDGYHSRLTYAVTEALTDSDDYSMTSGGIGILSNAGGGDSAISPENSAHFVILSHGKNGFGSIIESGAPSGDCAIASALEQENCNYQTSVTDGATFVSTHKQDDFDDIITFYMGRGVSPWQYQENSTNDIHLRRGDTIVSGAAGLMTSDLSAFSGDNVHIRASGGDADGIMRVVGNAGKPNPADPISSTNVASNYTGTVRVDNLCGEDVSGDGCFTPEIIYGGRGETITGAMTSMPPKASNDGTITLNYGEYGATGGVACTNGEVMVGFENGRTLCADTVEFNCPIGSVMKGFSGGRVICDTTSEPGCAAVSNVDNSCGGTFNLPETPHNQSFATYSGTCHMIENFSNATANGLMVAGDFTTSLANIQNYVDDLNEASRTETSCNTESSSLVRDAFRCQSGEWNEDGGGNVIPHRITERGNYGTNWPGITSSSRPAETISHPSYVSYPTSPALPRSVDANNNNDFHDCWCREDYRVQTINCGQGSGQRIRVQKHRCPQTGTNWNTVWTSSSSLTCECVEQEGLTDRWGSCEAFYEVPSGSMDGDVDRVYDLRCPGYNEVNRPRSEWDTSACTCPNRSDRVPDSDPEDCPAGFGNDFDFQGENYTDVESGEHERWICPGPNGKGGSVSSAAEAGYWDTAPFSEECVCDTTETSSIRRSCTSLNPQWQGPGVYYETIIDCSTGEFNEPDPPVQISGECYSCSWERPSGSPSQSSNSGPITATLEGTSCNCNGGQPPRPCAVVSGSTWDLYNACSCQANVRQR